MSFNSWLRNLRSALAPSRGARASRPRRSRVRLALEQLEDRTVPASFTAGNVTELIAAINAANLNAEADTITLAANKTFTLTVANNDYSHGQTGLPAITANNDLTILGGGSTIERNKTTWPGFRLIYVAAGASLRLENLTLQGGWSEQANYYGGGGAILNHGALTLNRVTVQNNLAWGGGGGIASSGSLTMNGVTVQNNTAYTLGGGIYTTGALTITGGNIQSNLAQGWPDTSAYGGGLYVGGGTATLSGVTIARNAAQGDPGRVGGYWDEVDQVWVSLPPSNGSAGYGGGMFVAAGTVTLSGVTLASNTAQGGNGWDGGKDPGTDGGNAFGGGLYAAGGTVTLLNCAVTGNTAKGGTGGRGKPNGAAGVGLGGGIYIDPLALVYLDAYTLAHIKNNQANNYANIFGSWVAF